MKRSDLTNALRFAGYHGDNATYTRLCIENRISKKAADEAFNSGARARAAGVRCECSDCTPKSAGCARCRMDLIRFVKAITLPRFTINVGDTWHSPQSYRNADGEITLGGGLVSSTHYVIEKIDAMRASHNGNQCPGGPHWIALEFHGKGDPFFGGNADDRTLGKDGRFMERYRREDRAIFASKDEALRAAERAPNRREGGLLSAIEPAPSAYEVAS